ncbi:MAG TPA: glycoside hydrolase family 57 protein [Candidatus Limnocylindria bacterium]|nr:glycoside hydrolase family 57 protein [Candidatus Limnocylindria bacterium]
MSEPERPVDLVLIWHHHQPDYRDPRDRRSRLPWVRLHATKDYLDMALHLERHPSVRATFNFVPSLLDQLEGAAAGESDELFELLARPVAKLEPAEHVEVCRRAAIAPSHAFERWPRYRTLAGRARRATPDARLSDTDLLQLEVWFLISWIDPLFHDQPEAARVLAQVGAFTVENRDSLLALHKRLLADVVPAYRRLAERGQVELSTTPYYHPILPLLVDLRSAKRARPDLPLPAEPLEAPTDARIQIERAIARHARAFGAPPSGLWPSEGSVSPEVVELVARSQLRWLATDEGVLWGSLPAGERRRDALYRPWRMETNAGEVTLFFRDHELSDRIGFVYQRWDPAEAVADFMARLRRIGREHGASGTPVVSVILDGENCWEGYAEDGAQFLNDLYSALEQAPDIRTRTPSDVIASDSASGRLTHLHTGSWIDADFHIWIGHDEKNRAWDLVSRTRKALIEAGATPESHPEAWEAMFRAEGSDWFWWFGEDHYTSEKATFDELFRAHLREAYQGAGLSAPAGLQVPVTRPRHGPDAHVRPIGFVRPVVDGERTHFYEWHAAGRYTLEGGGGSMHRAAGRVHQLFYGFDDRSVYLRLDFTPPGPPGAAYDLSVEMMTPVVATVGVKGLSRGACEVTFTEAGGRSLRLPDSACCIGRVLELALPFEGLGVKAGDGIELLVQLMEGGRPVESYPLDEPIRFTIPDGHFETAMWSV